MNLFPSAFAPCRAKNSAPGRTFRESQVTWRISRALAPAGSAIPTPSNTSLSFLPVSVALARAEFFRWLSVRFVATSCTCSSWLNPIFILMPDSPAWPRNFCRRCSELHRDLRTTPHLRSRGRGLICCKTAANENRLQPQLPARLCHLPHPLPGEVRHRNVTAVIHSHCRRRRGAIALPRVGCRGLRGGLVGLPRKIRRCEIPERRAV